MKLQLALAISLISALSASAITIDMVTVGNPGNAGDVQPQGSFGSVSYNYRIGKTEVTNAQYVEFLNCVDLSGTNALALYNSGMSSDARGGINVSGGGANGSKYEIKLGRDNNPVVFVSWYDAIRFANWMHNGGGVGDDTENGAYVLGVLGSGGVPTNGASITRDAGARWFLPSEDEWYKAAYHDATAGMSAAYFAYPTGKNTAPYSDNPNSLNTPDHTNTTNSYGDDLIANGYDDGLAVTGSTSFVVSQNYLTDAGAYTLADSPYGTFDQGGNVWEWNEAIISGSFRGGRGSSWSLATGNMGEGAGRRYPDGELQLLRFSRGKHTGAKYAVAFDHGICSIAHSSPQNRPPQSRLTSADGSDTCLIAFCMWSAKLCSSAPWSPCRQFLCLCWRGLSLCAVGSTSDTSVFGCRVAASYTAVMPSAHRIALKKLLETVTRRIAEDEARMLTLTNDEDRGQLVEGLADLHMRRNDLMDALSGDGDSH